MSHDIPKEAQKSHRIMTAFCELVKKHGALKMREHFQTIMVQLNEMQLSAYSHDRQNQINFLKELDFILKN